MRIGVAIIVSGLVALLASCANKTAGPVAPADATASAPAIVLPPPPVPVEPPPIRLACSGQAKQGGAILCLTEPNAPLALDGKPITQADAQGLAVIGLTRTQATPAIVSFADPLDVAIPFARRSAAASIEVLAREDAVSKFTMECGKIAPQSPEAKRKAEVSWVKKDTALKMFSAPLAPVAFIKPAEGPYSSPFGVTRTYVPRTKGCEGSTSVHNGQDIAVPTGTPIVAPMAGTVILADPDLFYEGGCIFLDHGRGLVSVFMHMSRIDVKPGDKLEQGAPMGLSGATGRVTGPHLHWAIKYRNVNDSDRGGDIWLDPTLLLQLNSASLTSP